MRIFLRPFDGKSTFVVGSTAHCSEASHHEPSYKVFHFGHHFIPFFSTKLNGFFLCFKKSKKIFQNPPKNKYYEKN